MNFAEIINSIRNTIKSSNLERSITLPDGRKGYVALDAAGNETIFTERATARTNVFKVSRVCDFIKFAESIPARYGAERAKTFRELLAYVDDNDVPVQVVLNDKLDSLSAKSAKVIFDLKPHRDFQRWMNAQNMTQTQFRNLVIELADQHDHPDLGGQLQILNYKVEISLDSAVETERDMIFAFQTKEAEGTFQIPKMLEVVCPVVAGAEFRAKILFEIVVIRPKNPSEKIKFSLVPYGQDRVHLLREAYGTVVETEIVKPTQEVLAAFVEGVLPVAYLRDAVGFAETNLGNETLMTIGR